MARRDGTVACDCRGEAQFSVRKFTFFSALVYVSPHHARSGFSRSFPLQQSAAYAGRKVSVPFVYVLAILTPFIFLNLVRQFQTGLKVFSCVGLTLPSDRLRMCTFLECLSTLLNITF